MFQFTFQTLKFRLQFVKVCMCNYLFRIYINRNLPWTSVYIKFDDHCTASILICKHMPLNVGLL